MDPEELEDFLARATREELESNIRAHYLRNRSIQATYAAMEPELVTSAGALQVSA